MTEFANYFTAIKVQKDLVTFEGLLLIGFASVVVTNLYYVIFGVFAM